MGDSLINAFLKPLGVIKVLTFITFVLYIFSIKFLIFFLVAIKSNNKTRVLHFWAFLRDSSVVTGFLNILNNTEVSLETLHANNIINKKVKSVKIILNGKIDKPISISNKILFTKGAKKMIQDSGGSFFE